ncbi:MAG: leucine-rich repeat domain-containing protein [Synergistaceae bacterium]|nr:leucine-rich repeat domain-containing protein [Synergistaceae bacterium]
MKRIFTLFLTVSIICGFFAAFSTRNAGGEELLNLSDQNFTVAEGVLTKYKGNGGDVIIPAGVTALEKNLFLNFYKDTDNFNKKKIKTLTFPSTLREIRYRALSNITVEKIVIPDAIREITIGQQAFAIPNTTDGGNRKSNLTEVRINAKSVILGGEGASDTKTSECFRVLNETVTNSALEKVIFTSESIRQADEIEAITRLFYNCKSLKEVVFSGNGSYVVGNQSFSGCGSLERVVFSEGMTGITGSMLFNGCASLKELILPESCNTLGAEFLRTSSSENTRHAIKDMAILSKELKTVDTDKSFLIDSNQKGLDIYAYPGTPAWDKLKETRHIKDDTQYPAKHTLKTLARGARITVQNAAGTDLAYGDSPSLTTVRWDAYRWNKYDGNGNENTGTNLEAGIIEAGYPSFETTVLDAWHTAISNDVSAETAEPDRFLLNSADHPFGDAGGIPLEDGDRVHFYKSTGKKFTSWYKDDGKITSLSVTSDMSVTLTLKDSDIPLPNIKVRVMTYSGDTWGIWGKIGDTDESGRITFKFTAHGDYLITPYDAAGTPVCDILPVSVYTPEIGISMRPGDVKLAADGNGSYIGTLGNRETSVLLSVKALNPESKITLAGDIDGKTSTFDETITLTQGEYTNDPIPVNVGLNRFTVTITPDGGILPPKNYQVVIMRKPDYAPPKLDSGKGNIGGVGSTGACTIGASDFIDSDNKPNMIYVKLLEASPIKVKNLPQNAGDDDVARAVFEAFESDAGTGLQNMTASEAIAVDSDGSVIANRETLRGKMSSREKAAYVLKDMVALPAFTAEIEADDNEEYTAAVTYEGAFATFKGVSAKDLGVFKLQNDGMNVYRFKSAPSMRDIVAGEFVITDLHGCDISPGDPIEGDELLTIAIKDDSLLDWDDDEKKITDPPTVAKATGGSGSGDSGTGVSGCDAGFGAGAAVFTLALAFHPRKKRY